MNALSKDFKFSLVQNNHVLKYCQLLPKMEKSLSDLYIGTGYK